MQLNTSNGITAFQYRFSLSEQVKECVAHSRYRFEREMILRGWSEDEITVGAYEFHNVALFNESTEEYFRNNLALLDPEIRASLFRDDLTIYTKVRDQVPSYYGEHSEIDNSIVAGIPCQPCSIAGSRLCPEGHFDCMHSIEPNHIVDKILHELSLVNNTETRQ